MIMRILYVYSNSLFGWNFLRDNTLLVNRLAKKNREKGHEVDVITIAGWYDSKCDENINIESIRVIPERLKEKFKKEIILLNNIRFIADFLQNRKNKNYDLIHCFDYESGIFSRILKQILNIPLVLSYNRCFSDVPSSHLFNIDTRFESLVMGWLLQGVDKIIVNTSFMKNNLQDAFVVEDNRILKKPYLIDAMNNNVQNDEKINFLFVSELTEGQGVREIFDLVAHLKSRLDVTLYFITNFDVGIYGKLLSQFIRKCNLASNIEWRSYSGLNYLKELCSLKRFFILSPYKNLDTEILACEFIGTYMPIIYQPTLLNKEIFCGVPFCFQYDFWDGVDYEKLYSIVCNYDWISTYKKFAMFTTEVNEYEDVYVELVNSSSKAI